MNSPACILMVKFKSPLSLSQIESVIESRIDEFRAFPGLLQKYYTHEPATGEFAGVYLWESQEALQVFFESDLRKTIASAYKTQGQPRVEVLEVVKPLR